MDRKYDYKQVISNIYYDLIDLIGPDGLNAELDIDIVIATIAAPITRLDFQNTPSDKLKGIMREVKKYMKEHHRWQNLNHDALVRRIEYDLIPSYSETEMKNFVREFRMIDDFSEEDIAIINPDIYKVYKTQKDRLDRDNVPYRIQYGTMSDVQGSVKGIRWQEEKYNTTREYCNQEIDGGYWTVNPEITEEEWYRLLKEKTSGKLRNVLMAYLDIANHRASILNIEQWYGIDMHSVNGCNAALGRRAKTRMNIDVHDPDGTSRCWSLPMDRGRNEGENGFVWEMRPELCRAVERISNEQGWSKVFTIKK